ncbi:hypothetical protein FA95DRAFT_1487893 [Auriscalpium vulgare]|uniref:Uncharacterized protein n=1 Tax=Auriscalpium vulgare TaxID=40419 RepID=A0ACB8S1C8_9AGAM|nr:hypothetical protein FA95DRAFT_1487893 [Auriscalpium vulgare]
MLPDSLWLLVSALALSLPDRTAAQTPSRALLLNTPLALAAANFSSTSTPLLFALPDPPSSSSPLTVSIALCSAASSAAPRFFITNDSQVAVPGPGGGTDVWELVVDSGGLANVTMTMDGGAGKLAVWGGGASDSVEIGASDSGPLHEHLPEPPLLGDSTSNQALLYSPPFGASPLAQPTYPNYTLPPAELAFPTPPDGPLPNYTLILAPLTAALTSQPQTACALRSHADAKTAGDVLRQQNWLRDEQGWRTEWLLDGLTPLTNYTAYTIQDGTKVNGPTYFTTKSASFSCQLVHSLPFCPTTSYAVPLPPPPAQSAAYDSKSLPPAISTPLLAYLTNFTTSLLTSACGRDHYSPLKSCADCQRAYRHWLCAVSFPRCGEFPHVAATATTSASASTAGATGAQQPFAVPAALVPQPSGVPARNPAFPAFSQPYTALLPCLETCYDVDRACPAFMGFKCPRPEFNANVSYGVGFVDGVLGKEGVVGGGSTGAAQDRWGNVWCNPS